MDWNMPLAYIQAESGKGHRKKEKQGKQREQGDVAALGRC